MIQPNGNIEELQALKKDLLRSLHCALPGIVESFDSDRQMAVVRLTVKSLSGMELPLLRDVPVYMPVHFEVGEGDHCLVVFSDRDIDRWILSGEPSVPGSGRMHSLSDGFAFIGFDSGGGQSPGGGYTKAQTDELLSGKSDMGHNHDGTYSPLGHTHDDRYYTESETDTLLGGKSDTGHTHDSRYYTESETDTLLSGKSNTGHTHAAGDITSGTLPIGRGGSGNTGTSATTTITSIATAASGCEISSANYASWGKIAQVQLAVKKTAAVDSGTTTLCTLESGKRPKYNAMGHWAWNNGALIKTNGQVQVNGKISAGGTVNVYGIYVLA